MLLGTMLVLTSVFAQAPPVDDAKIPAVGELKAIAAKKQALSNAFMPTGSPAHLQWIQQLADALRKAGVQNLATPSFTFTKWTPHSWSLTVLDGPNAGPVSVSTYAAYSGATPAGGVTAPLAYFSGVTSFLGPPGQPFTPLFQVGGETLYIAVNGQSLAEALSSVDVSGKIVVYDLPAPQTPIEGMEQLSFFVNDPGSTLLPFNSTGSTSALFLIGTLNGSLQAAGALGAVGVLPFHPDMAKNYFFTGRIAGMPALVLDEDAGKPLEQAIINASSPPSANLTLVADTNPNAQANSITGVIPGSSDKEIFLNTHDDGSNIVEDNGAIVVWALAKYFASLPLGQRPYTISFFISGSHFVDDVDAISYVKNNAASLRSNALVDVAIEHVGGVELAPQADGTFAPDGQPDATILTLGPLLSDPSKYSAPVVEATIEYAKRVNRSIVCPFSVFPFGVSEPWLPVTNTTATIDAPAWLLVYDIPHNKEFTKWLDFQQLRDTAKGYAEMVTTFLNTPADDFTTAYTGDSARRAPAGRLLEPGHEPVVRTLLPSHPRHYWSVANRN
jgi:hypothetical protein